MLHYYRLRQSLAEMTTIFSCLRKEYNLRLHVYTDKLVLILLQVITTSLFIISCYFIVAILIWPQRYIARTGEIGLTVPKNGKKNTADEEKNCVLIGYIIICD